MEPVQYECLKWASTKMVHIYCYCHYLPQNGVIFPNMLTWWLLMAGRGWSVPVTTETLAAAPAIARHSLYWLCRHNWSVCGHERESKDWSLSFQNQQANTNYIGRPGRLHSCLATQLQRHAADVQPHSNIREIENGIQPLQLYDA